MATATWIELRFRLPDGSDIGANNFTAAATVATLKEHVIEQWPKDKENGPKTIKEVKLIYAGRVLENHRTLAESRIPVVGDLFAGVVTIHVVLRPPVPGDDESDIEGSVGCSCSIL